MAHAIVVSKDRAAQLHLCLEALIKNGGHIFDKITVIHHSSNEEFNQGYGKTAAHFPNIKFIKQTNYYADVIDSINESDSLVSFFTDDDILYGRIPLEKEHLENLFNDFEIIGAFSLRLGLNTVVQDPYNGIMAEPPSSGFHHLNEQIIVWRWSHCPSYGNFGYPLSVDGHIFRTNEIKQILLECRFNNPNQQEVAMQANLKMLPSLMAAFTKSVVINTPLNRVQDTCLNRAGETYGQSAEEMNIKYLAGDKLDLNSIDFSKIVGCHQELEIKWITN